MTRFADSLSTHVADLCAEHRIAIEVKPGASPRASRRTRRIVIRPIRGRSSYFIALHEIGHVVGANPRLRLDQEAVAWRWALDNAIVGPTPGVWQMIWRCLSGYRDRADRWASMKLPDADSDYWKLMKAAALEGGGLFGLR